MAREDRHWFTRVEKFVAWLLECGHSWWLSKLNLIARKLEITVGLTLSKFLKTLVDNFSLWFYEEFGDIDFDGPNDWPSIYGIMCEHFVFSAEFTSKMVLLVMFLAPYM